MAKRKARPLAAVAVSLSLLLAGCGSVKEELGVEGEPGSGDIDKDDSRVVELNNRANGYWRELAEGDSVGAFDYFTDRCEDERISTYSTLLSSYEQRHINKMAYTGHSTDELINSMETRISMISHGNSRATVHLESSIADISMDNLKWQRSDHDNKWYLDSCRPPFDGMEGDQASYRIEMERDERAYRDGLIEDDGDYQYDAPEESADEHSY